MLLVIYSNIVQKEKGLNILVLTIMHPELTF